MLHGRAGVCVTFHPDAGNQPDLPHRRLAEPVLTIAVNGFDSHPSSLGRQQATDAGELQQVAGGLGVVFGREDGEEVCAAAVGYGVAGGYYLAAGVEAAAAWDSGWVWGSPDRTMRSGDSGRTESSAWV